MPDIPYFTPSMIDAEIAFVQLGVRTAEPLISNSSKLDKDFKEGFFLFAVEWHRFRNSLGIMTKNLNQTWDTVQEFKTRLYDWVDRANALGASIPIHKPKDQKPSFWSTIPWWGWIGGISVLIYSMSPLKTAYAVRSFMPSKKRK